jgi:hypothetical protein
VFVVTVTVTVALSAEPQLFVTLTQYDVVVAGETTTFALVAPPIGEEVLPEFPVYHWYESVAVPAAVTLSDASCPVTVVTGDGCAVIDGATQETIGTVFVSVTPTPPLMNPLPFVPFL